MIGRTFCAILAASLAVSAAEEKLSFNEHIRPILSDNCFACHGTDANHRKAKLRLDTPEGAFAERNDLRAVVAGKVEDSELWHRIVSTDPDEVMPPPDSHKSPLTPAQRTLIKRWIEQGAVYQKHWAYEPIARTEIPASGAQLSVLNSQLPPNPIDAFILEKLAPRKLALSPEATPEVLLRRVTLDLTGLPPTATELDAFLADKSPDAYARAVDRLLASPHYGENFARTWLDAVRYGDTHGMHLDNERTLWPYRDWVVRAYNENKPFDQFTVEQLAGDLLPKPTVSQLVATGFNRSIVSTSEGGSLEAEAEARNNADRTDTTAAVWLGLTTNCASCHDHKFDPLTQRETYALGAFFKGLADRVWDGNVRLPGPRVLIPETPQQQQRIEFLATALPPLEAALRARGEQLLPSLPKLAKKPITYEVVWAEDGDMPTVKAFRSAAPTVGEWRSGADVPLAGGSSALRLEGTVAERVVNFSTGEVPLVLRTGLRAFAHFRADPAQPPRAVSIELIAEGQLKRAVWGDPSAFGSATSKDALVMGPLPLPGAYYRLEFDAVAAGLAEGKSYTGVRLAQSDGLAWWDRIGTVNTSPSASDDPLLSADAWINPLRKRETDDQLVSLPVPLDVKYLISLFVLQQNAEEVKRRADYFRDYIYGPLRGALESEAIATRRLQTEQIHYELALPGTLIARELPKPPPAHVLVRGQYDNLGEVVAPATPAFLPPLRPANPARVTRLDFARWLVDGRNPLPPRIAVNRLWQQVFGYGLVRTPADFGSQGDPPTHPELLDWLASEYIATGWDTKKMIRLLVTSRTYRQDSRATPSLLELDPANKLLARGPRVRLDAEVLRDQALAVGGLLIPTIGGPPVRPYQPINVWEPVAYPDSNTRFYVQDKDDALYRRSLYTFIKRNAPAPALATFDAPSREAFCPVRGRTNTPLQALALMNDVQQFEAARAFAEKLLARDETDSARLAYAFRAVTARVPTPVENRFLAEALATQRARFAADPVAARQVLANGESKIKHPFPAPEFAAYTLVANLLLNLDETVTRN